MASILEYVGPENGDNGIVSEITRLHTSLYKATKYVLYNAIRIGELLTQQKASLKHGEWLPWIEANLPFERTTAFRYMRCFEHREMLQRATFDLADAYRLLAGPGKIQAQLFTGDNENYTPGDFLDLVRKVLGTIDLDPASNDFAQKTVKAKRFFDKQTNGLEQEWSGRVFLNPPYSNPEIGQFIHKLVYEYWSGRVATAILLTNDNTDTEWFHLAATKCMAFCLRNGRISFYQEGGERTSPTNGQTVFYFGHNTALFKKVFGESGVICRIL